MEHHSPIIEETEKEVCFQTIAPHIILQKYKYTSGLFQIDISYILALQSCHYSHSTTFYGLQSSPPSFNTKVASLLSSRPANHQAILMYLDAKKQQGTDSSCVTIVPLQNTLIVHIFKVKNVVSVLNRILICLTPHNISRDSVYQINNQATSGDDCSSSK